MKRKRREEKVFMKCSSHKVAKVVDSSFVVPGSVPLFVS
jgi:hypothetical protein